MLGVRVRTGSSGFDARLRQRALATTGPDSCPQNILPAGACRLSSSSSRLPCLTEQGSRRTRIQVACHADEHSVRPRRSPRDNKNNEASSSLQASPCLCCNTMRHLLQCRMHSSSRGSGAFAPTNTSISCCRSVATNGQSFTRLQLLACVTQKHACSAASHASSDMPSNTTASAASAAAGTATANCTTAAPETSFPYRISTSERHVRHASAGVRYSKPVSDSPLP